MSKSKKNQLHIYTREQNEWIKNHPDLKRSELARKFNKKFDAKVSPVAIAKRKQRMNNEPAVVKGNNIKKLSRIPAGIVSTKDILELIREQGRMIEKLIERM